MEINIEIHYARRWDGLATFCGGVLTQATLLQQTGLPVVRLTGENYRADDGRLKGELVVPIDCPPLTLVRPISATDVPLLRDALTQGYTLDPRSAYTEGALRRMQQA
jgi:hypothetical protein